MSYTQASTYLRSMLYFVAIAMSLFLGWQSPAGHPLRHSHNLTPRPARHGMSVALEMLGTGQLCRVAELATSYKPTS